MSEEELAAFICPDNLDLGRRALAAASPTERAVYERMAQVCDELALWQAGVGPKPEGVIVCGPKQIRAGPL